MQLTKRQTQIVELLAQGLTAEEAAAKLSRALPTVRRHLQMAYQRVGARNTPHLVAKAVAGGWIKVVCLSLAITIAANCSDQALRRPTARVRIMRPTSTRMYA
ncbi:helix-turn-helix transcriptional regulator [Halomonas sp. HP20-15]|uniref:helix-turn-helix transcriptional regulator n=1 Tax=Halomonas sp. HP20-15 TaxID=3085901 RepID=UPI0029810B51|nr:helix-turn-helix transcriptional regulator [Halomonas sp. HP20-15]MDW5376809.1 helix-turn-helix transcriptional regulator [Halomonas sp. HP20-15]